VSRRELFPEEGNGPRAHRHYYQVHLYPLQRLREPILSRRFRRIVFIPTTYAKLMNAVEINDLFDESPLEDRLWAAMKRFEIDAQRQYWVEGKAQQYALDFAVFCDQGKIDVETDGDSYHFNAESGSEDNQRNNELGTLDWHVLRFDTTDIRERMEEYVVPTVMRNINRLGGVSDAGLIPRRFDPDDPAGPRQLTLFDGSPPYGDE
jgi:very-short-patch-repair endonuclease